MFYEKYKKLCALKGVSASTAAVQAGFNKGTVSVWKQKYTEGKDVRPDKEVLDKLSIYFGVSESWLLDLDIEDEPAVVVENMTPAKQKLLDSVAGMSEEQLTKLLGVIEAAKKMV